MSPKQNFVTIGSGMRNMVKNTVFNLKISSTQNLTELKKTSLDFKKFHWTHKLSLDSQISRLDS
jgi:hypothetical protein